MCSFSFGKSCKNAFYVVSFFDGNLVGRKPFSVKCGKKKTRSCERNLNGEPISYVKSSQKQFCIQTNRLKNYCQNQILLLFSFSKKILSFLDSSSSHMCTHCFFFFLPSVLTFFCFPQPFSSFLHDEIFAKKNVLL